MKDTGLTQQSEAQMTATNAQINIVMRERKKGRTQEQAAVKANLKSRQTVAKYEQLGQLPSELKKKRSYRTYISRHLSPDSIVPVEGDPQALNRYAYVRNNPISLADESGHCWGIASGLRNVEFLNYSVRCENMDAALEVAAHPESTWLEWTFATSYFATETLAHTGLVVGTAIAAPACYSGLGTVICTGGAALSNSDGDPSPAGEIQMATQASQSAWKLNPFARGTAIDRVFNNLGDTFPTIDRFKNGVATSVKSIDLGAKSYQNTSTLSSTIKGQVNQLNNFNGASFNGINITGEMIKQKELLLAIPSNATAAQLATIDQVTLWAMQEYQIIVTTIVVQ